jgi:signal transduction histidine kinase
MTIPQFTIRTRLTLLYAAVFTATGAGLLTVMYLLIRREIFDANQVLAQDIGNAVLPPGIPTSAVPTVGENAEAAGAIASSSSRSTMQVIITESGIAFMVMAALALLLCWLVAGRALRPLRQITQVAGHLSQDTLDSRIALDGPADEIKVLADTFDDMLDRLGRGFATQQLFAANASHELRTPLTIIQTAAETALARPSRPEADYRRALETIAVATRRSEHLLASLLRLAQARQVAWERLDLAEAAAEALDGWPVAGPRLITRLEPAAVAADPVLVNLLLGNLLHNAARYNIDGGSVWVRTEQLRSGARLRVENTGPVLTIDEVSALRRPFQRGAARTGAGVGAAAGEGFGLGLAIVDAIVAAHGGRWTAQPRTGGGLDVTVDLPPNTDRPC